MSQSFSSPVRSPLKAELDYEISKMKRTLGASDLSYSASTAAGTSQKKQRPGTANARSGRKMSPSKTLAPQMSSGMVS